MKRFLPLCLLLVFACSRTPTTGEMPDGMAEASLTTMRQLADELRAIRDRESWQKGQGRILELANAMKAKREQGNGLLKMNLPTRQKMEEKYADKLSETSADLKAQFERIVREVPQGKEYVRQIEDLLKAKLDETKK